MVKRTRMGVMLALLASLALPAAAGASTTVATTVNPIKTFAHDGSWIGWDTWPHGACALSNPASRFTVKNLESSRTLSIGDHGACVARLAVGTNQVIWNSPYATARSRTWTTTFDEIFPQPMRWYDNRGGSGTFPGPYASDGPLLVETLITDGGTPTVITGGQIDRIDGFTRSAIPNTGPAAFTRVYAGRVAYAPIVIGSPASQRPYQIGPVQVRDAMTGDLVSTISTSGRVSALAFGGGRLALLTVDGAGHKQIRLFDPGSGNLLSSHAVPDGTAATIDVTIAGVLYRVGGQLRLLSLHSDARAVVANLASTPTAISIEGTTIAWTVYTGGHGYIRTTPAPTV